MQVRSALDQGKRFPQKHENCLKEDTANARSNGPQVGSVLYDPYRRIVRMNGLAGEVLGLHERQRNFKNRAFAKRALNIN